MSAITGLDAAEVFAATVGHIYVAPVGTAAPTGAVAALNASFLELGYTDDTGVKFSAADTFTAVNAWQSGVPLRQIPKNRAFSAKFVLLQLNSVNSSLFSNGATVSVGSPTTEYTWTVSTQPTGNPLSFVFDAVDSQRGVTYRWYIPNAMVTAQDDLTVSRSGPTTYGVTVTALAPATGNNFYQVFTNDALETS